MRILIFFLALFFVNYSHAGLVLGAHGGQGKDNGKGIENFNGPVYGGRIGWRWNFFSLELARSSYSLSAKKGQTDDFYIEKAEGDGSVTDILARFYLFRYLSFFAGISSLDLDFNIKLTNINGDTNRSFTSEGSTYDKGSIVGAAVHLPIGKGFDFFGAYGIRKWSSTAADLGLENAPDVAIHEWHAGILWHWDTGRGRRK